MCIFLYYFPNVLFMAFVTSISAFVSSSLKTSKNPQKYNNIITNIPVKIKNIK